MTSLLYFDVFHDYKTECMSGFWGFFSLFTPTVSNTFKEGIKDDSTFSWGSATLKVGSGNPSQVWRGQENTRGLKVGITDWRYDG